MPRFAIDFHVHTRASPDGLTRPEDMVRAARARGLDGIAITDHDRSAGYDRLVRLGLADPSGGAVDGFLVIPGVEVSTCEGHILILGQAFDTPARRGGMPARQIVGTAQARGLLAVAAHPFDRTRSGVGPEVLARVPFDAIETFNSKSIDPRANEEAARYTKASGLPGIAGSDAHFARTVGRAHTIVECDTLECESVLGAVRAGRSAVAPGTHTHLEVAEYWLRGWWSRPWMFNRLCRMAVEWVGPLGAGREEFVLGPTSEPGDTWRSTSVPALRTTGSQARSLVRDAEPRHEPVIR